MFLLFSSLLGNIGDEDEDDADVDCSNIGLRTVFVVSPAWESNGLIFKESKHEHLSWIICL